MKLIVLGNSGTYPGPLRACSGYLLIEGETRLLLDCGPGVMGNLQKHVTIEELTGVVLSHMHADHFLDLIVMRYACVQRNHRRRDPLPVYMPPGGIQTWDRITAILDETNRSFQPPCELMEYREETRCQVGAFEIRVSALEHYVPSYGIDVRGSGRLVYSGDTRPCPGLPALARGADVFLCEATYLEEEANSTGVRGHLTASEAGEVAAQADVGRLLLTHVHPTVDEEQVLEHAKAAFGGDAALAEQGASYVVSAR
ncbi:MAG: MBL fold metallo-hydrolase [Chloroflexi bacterium]|nr:MBL fold metallo-hydrolase [Chloroflexota bacterium]